MQKCSSEHFHYSAWQLCKPALVQIICSAVLHICPKNWYEEKKCMNADAFVETLISMNEFMN